MSAPTPQLERKALMSLYPGKKWQEKVAAMSADQVKAVFLRLKEQGKVK